MRVGSTSTGALRSRRRQTPPRSLSPCYSTWTPTPRSDPKRLGEWFFVRFTSPSANARLDLNTFFGLGVGIIGDEATDS